MAINKEEHYDKLKAIHEKLAEKNKDRLVNILDDTKLNLHRDLSEDKFLYIDTDTIKKLASMTKKLGTETEDGSILKGLKVERDTLYSDVNDAKTIWDSYDETNNKEKQHKAKAKKEWQKLKNELTALDTHINNMKGSIEDPTDGRRKEYKGLFDAANRFKSKIDEDYFKFAGEEEGEIKINDSTETTYNDDVKTLFFNTTPPSADKMNFSFIDKGGEALEKKADGIVITLKKVSGGEIQVVCKPDAGKFLDADDGKLDFKNLKLYEYEEEDILGDEVNYDDFNFTKPIKLSILAKDTTGDFPVGHSKKIKFKFDNVNVTKRLKKSAQQARYDGFNIGGNSINNYTENFYARHHKEVENKLIDEAIGNAVPDEQKPALRKRISALTPDGTTFSPFIPESRRNQLGIGFKDYFFKNIKPGEDDISSQAAYDNFLLTKIPEELKKYLDKELKRQIESVAIDTVKKPDSRDLHTPLTKEMLTFRQEQEDRSKDERSQTQSLKTATSPKWSNRKNTKPRRPLLTRAGLRGMLGKKDVSYLRFFNNQTEVINEQKTRIVTDEKNNKVENVGYSGDIKVETQGIYANFKLDDGQEIKLHGGDQTKLIHSLLNEPKIPYGKMRMHMAYNVIKAMIKLAHKNNITLEHADKNSNQLMELTLDNKKNIVVQTKNESTGRTQIVSTPFSEETFALENDTHQLRSGVDVCMVHFNTVMNETHKQYKKATSKRVLSYFKHTRSRFPTSRFKSPIKKLMNIRSKVRTLKFDFEGLSVGEYSISFRKNKYEISGGKLEKPIKSRDLGKLLNRRVKGVRIFDGVELKIFSATYQEIIKNLRQNSKLANTNFGVKDPLKKRVYFINETGTLCYVPLTAGNKNPIKRSKASLRMHKEYGVVEKGTPSRVASTQEANEFYQNPLLMGKLMKAMNLGLYKL